MAEALIMLQGGGIDSSDVTAKKADVLEGKTALTSDSADEIAAGTMKNNAGWKSENNNAGARVTIPKGYHDGKGYVSVKSLASQTNGDATAANITNGKTAYVDGVMITGNGADNTARYNDGYNAGVYAADSRVNAASESYKSGYNTGYAKGVADADGRANPSSANYQAGYTAGVNASKVKSMQKSMNNGDTWNVSGYNVVGYGMMRSDFRYYAYDNGSFGITGKLQFSNGVITYTASGSTGDGNNRLESSGAEVIVYYV